MPVPVQNHKTGPTVLTRGKDEEWIFGGAGSPDGSDYQQLPDDINSDANFLRMCRKGILGIASEDEAQVHLELQASTWAEQQTASVDAAMATVTNEVDRDLVATIDEKGLTGEITRAAPNSGIEGTKEGQSIVVAPAPDGEIAYDANQPTSPDQGTDFRSLVQQAAQEE